MAQEAVTRPLVSRIPESIHVSPRRLLTHFHSRNMVNIFLYVAEQSSRYYPATDLDEMLSIFLPILTKNVCLSVLRDSPAHGILPDHLDNGSRDNIVRATDGYAQIYPALVQVVGSLQFSCH